MKILLAVDGSSFSKRMLAYLAAHEQWLDTAHSYTVMTATPAVPPRAAAVLDKALVKGYYTDETEKVFKPLRPFFKRHGIDAQFVSKVGAAAEVIAKQAQEGEFDLVVMGSHGHGSVVNMVLGSVVTKVLAHCQVPVLVVR